MRTEKAADPSSTQIDYNTSQLLPTRPYGPDPPSANQKPTIHPFQCSLGQWKAYNISSPMLPQPMKSLQYILSGPAHCVLSGQDPSQPRPPGHSRAVRRMWTAERGDNRAIRGTGRFCRTLVSALLDSCHPAPQLSRSSLPAASFSALGFFDGHKLVG